MQTKRYTGTIPMDQDSSGKPSSLAARKEQGVLWPGKGMRVMGAERKNTGDTNSQILFSRCGCSA